MNEPCPIPTRWPYSKQTWTKRERFTTLLEEACDDKGIAVRWLDDEKWTGILESPTASAPIFGYDLGLNPSSGGKIADSKADTYRTLDLYQVPAVHHERVTPNLSNGIKVDVDTLATAAIKAVGLPLVAKPDAMASGGSGVELCEDERQVFGALGRLTAGNKPAAVSPFLDFDEYRAVVLDGEVRAVIEKTRPAGGWMHNYSQGAEHRLMDPSDALYRTVGNLGVRATAALGLRFTTVDVAHMPAEDEAAILEINDAVSIISHHDPALRKTAHAVYGDAAELRLSGV